LLNLTPGELKSYLRIDGDEDDSRLILLILGAKEHLLEAGIKESDKALYKIAVMTYILLNYENYDKSLNIEKLEMSLETAILKLRTYGGTE
jgi:uncharacterized phage protein (predicted DNA packaging)